MVATVAAVRPGGVWEVQYRFVCAITASGGGAPHAVWSSVVWASLTRVASYPLASAPWSVERMHASVCAPTTTSRPTPRPDSTGLEGRVLEGVAVALLDERLGVARSQLGN